MKRFFQRPPSRQNVRRDVADELSFHLQGRVDELVAGGMSREEAEREARRRFGDRAQFAVQVERMDQASYERKRLRDALDDVRRDVALAARTLWRRPAYAIAVILTLALGVGANTAIFSVADALLFRAPPFAHPEQLVTTWGLSGGELFGLRAHTHSFQSIETYSEWAVNIGDDATAVRAEVADVSVGLFPMLGVRPARGHVFTARDGEHGARTLVILSDAFWRSQFAADSAIVGKSIRIEGAPVTVIGVMPPDFHFPSTATKLWTNTTFDRGNPAALWSWQRFRLVARLRDGHTVAAAQADVRAAASVVRHENPLWDPGPTYGQDAKVTPFKQSLAGSARTTLLVLLGVVFALLLIACANVANLVLVRVMERDRELAVRTALGCSRFRLARQLLTENLLLGAIGGSAAIVLAWGGVRLLNAALPPQIPRTAPIAVDARVLAFTASVSLFASLLFGLWPAIRAARAVRARGLIDLRGSSRGLQHRRVANTLAVLQLALAVTLVAGSGLLLRSFDALRQVNPGFNPEQVVSARVTLPTKLYESSTKRSVFLGALLSEVRKAPGVVSAAAVDRPPLRGPVYGMALRVQGQFEDTKHALPSVAHVQMVTPEYFRTMGIRIVQGRGFTDADRDSTPWVVVVSERMARTYWPEGHAVGQHIGLPYASPWMEVVGVAAEVQQDSLSGTDEQTIYRALVQWPQTDFTVVARTSGDASVFANVTRRAIATLEPSAPVSDVRTMTDVVSSSLARTRFTTWLVAGFAALALLLGAVGVYGVVASTVVQRTREFGVRMALGASPMRVMVSVLGRGVLLAGIGALLGLVLALAATRSLKGLLFGVTSTDAVTFISAPALLLIVALVATWLPARRALSSDPLTALRAE